MKRERTVMRERGNGSTLKRGDDGKSFLEKIAEKPTRVGTGRTHGSKDFLPLMASQFNMSFLGIIYNLALLGATDEQIANALNVSKTSFIMWKKREDVAKTLKEGKIGADTKVAAAMYQAAIGYSHEDEVILSNRVKEFDGYGRIVREYNDPIRLKTIKHYPPNAKLIMRWLQIRQPEVWSDKRATINQNIINFNGTKLDNFSNEELMLLGKLGLDTKAIGNGNFDHAEIIEEEFNEEPDDDGYDYEKE